MFKKILQFIFMDKRGRAAAKKLRDAPDAGKTGGEAPPPPPDATAATGDDRAALMRETMAIYRQRREEYEQLDEDVRERMTKIASEKLAGKD